MNTLFSIHGQKQTVAAYSYGALPLWSSIMFGNRDQERSKGFLRNQV